LDAQHSGFKQNLEDKKQTIESNCKTTVAECKEFYRSNISNVLSQSKLYSEKELQKHHGSEKKKALEKFKQASSSETSNNIWASKEEELKSVRFSMRFF
jgi:hypothetical protein